MNSIRPAGVGAFIQENGEGNCIKCDQETNWHMCPRCFFGIAETKNHVYRNQWIAVLDYLNGELPSLTDCEERYPNSD